MKAAEPQVELQLAKAQLLEAHQMASIGRLLAGIVHEIKSPIGSIFSNNEVLSLSLNKLQELVSDGQPEALERARAIIETCRNLAAVDRIACQRIESVIRGLKTFARPADPDLRRVDLNENLRDTLKLTQAEFRRRITVETDFGNLPEVECYPQLLNQVFLNLLVNAGQAIEGEGTITVRTREEDGWVHIVIADNGRGMTPEQQKKVFASGFTTKPVGEGTGLGLAISREIVEEKHRGAITFESAPGAGTTFHVRIPVRQSRDNS
ncbi:MAG: ATP-binding protein [Bryobacteraceae bacterium]